MELQADAEHQQDDADFGQLLGQRRIGHEAWGVGSDQCTGKQVAHERRQVNPVSDVPQEQRRGEPAGKREDQVVVVQGVSIAADPILSNASFRRKAEPSGRRPNGCLARSPACAKMLRRKTLRAAPSGGN
jgi:hypothetical protein